MIRARQARDGTTQVIFEPPDYEMMRSATEGIGLLLMVSATASRDGYRFVRKMIASGPPAIANEIGGANRGTAAACAARRRGN